MTAFRPGHGVIPQRAHAAYAFPRTKGRPIVPTLGRLLPLARGWRLLPSNSTLHHGLALEPTVLAGIGPDRLDQHHPVRRQRRGDRAGGARPAPPKPETRHLLGHGRGGGAARLADHRGGQAHGAALVAGYRWPAVAVDRRAVARRRRRRR